MTNLLIYIIVILAVIQPSKKRLYPALVFAILTLSHLYFSRDMDGFAYYFSAVLTDLLIMALIVRSDSILTLHLMVVSITSILLNTFGWVLWEFYFPPMMYDTAFIILYLYAISKLFYGGGDVGDYTNSKWHIGFFGCTFEGHRDLHGVGKK